MAEPFYLPLPTATSIRLLTILPGNPSDELDCSLQTVELSEAPPYDALSYVWGDPNPPVQIRCSGLGVTVTPNLADALYQIRVGPRKSFVNIDPPRENLSPTEWRRDPDLLAENTTQERVLWVDALCIDQHNLSERSQQVRMMVDIYREAKRVMIWLGKAEEKTGAAIDLIIQSRFHYQDEMNIHDGCKPWIIRAGIKRGPLGPITLGQIPSIEVNRARGFPEFETPEWSALIRFFRAAWFSRVWVIQELAMANCAHVLIGAHTIDWDSVGVAVIWLAKKRYTHIAAFGGHAIVNITLLDTRRSTRDSTNIRPTLLGILSLLYTWNSTDPRDRLYAVLGLAEETRNLDKCSLLVPDYSKTLLEVYQDLARYIIENDLTPQNSQLGVLSAVQHLPGDPDDGFPSWVPRWDRPRFSSINSRLTLNDQWSAAQASIAAFKFSDDLNGLNIKGFQFDTIKEVDDCLSHAVINTPAASRKNSKLVWDAMNKLWKRSNVACEAYIDGLIFGDAFAATVTAGQDVEFLVEDGDPFTAQDFEAYHLDHCWEEREELKMQNHINRTSPDAALDIRTQTQPGILEPASSPSIEDLLSTVKALHITQISSSTDPQVIRQKSRQFEWGVHKTNQNGYIFFITERGYMGLGPATTQVGDRACILFGGDIPYVLRRQISNYQLVGECYLHGIMRGEAMNKFRAKQFEEEVFEIR